MLYAIVDDGRSVYLHICTFSKKAGTSKRKWEIKLIAKFCLVHYCGNESNEYIYIKGYLELHGINQRVTTLHIE